VPKQSSARRAPYAVGYGRPPVQTRFKPGQSGNPRGRPRKSPPEDLALAQIDPLLAATLRVTSEGVAVNVGGRVKTVGGEEALIRTLMDHALSGDIRATRILLDLRAQAQEAARVQAQSANSEEMVALTLKIARLLRMTEAQGDENSDNAPGVMPMETQQEGLEASRVPPDRRYQDPRLYEDAARRRQETQAAKTRAIASVQAEEPAAEPIPPAPLGGTRGPLIAPSQPLSGPGYGLGGKVRPAPRCGTFK
jgi:hypothetical protein